MSDTPLEKILNAFEEYKVKQITLREFLEIIEKTDKESEKY